MANPWFRLWSDMVNDPKWRTIARVSKQEISRVIAVALHMMTCASNATDRGLIDGWSDEDVATALDIETADVSAIREAMQGRILEGDYMTGWEKRQPKREREEAPSTDRVRAFRERNATETKSNAVKRHETPREEESRVEESREELNTKPTAAPKKSKSPQKTPLPPDFCISDRVRNWANQNGHANLDRHFENFIGSCRARGYTYVDWDEALMNAIRNDWAKLKSLLPATAPRNSGQSKDLLDEVNRQAQELINGGVNA